VQRAGLLPAPDNSIGMPRPPTARMTGAPVDRPELGRTHETVAYLAGTERSNPFRSSEKSCERWSPLRLGREERSRLPAALAGPPIAKTYSADEPSRSVLPAAGGPAPL